METTILYGANIGIIWGLYRDIGALIGIISLLSQVVLGITNFRDSTTHLGHNLNSLKGLYV